MAHPLEIILITNSTPYKYSHSPTHITKRSYNLLQICSYRISLIRWIYDAEPELKYSRSTLYLALSVLDRLIVLNFECEAREQEVLAAAILLICTKFNEIYPVSVKTLQYLPAMKFRHSRDDFLDMESRILEKLQYNVVQEERFYQNMAALQDRLAPLCKDKPERVIETAVRHPHLFRYGRNVLLKAIEHLARRTPAKAEHRCDNFFYEEVNQIMSELSELHGSFKIQPHKLNL